MRKNNEYTDYEKNPVEISDVVKVHIAKGKKRREIKDLAADLAYYGTIPSSDGSYSLSIDSYDKDKSREHRILHKVYNRYKAKNDLKEFENIPLIEVKGLDKDTQQKWFTAQMNKGARNVLPPVLALASGPAMLEGLITAPLSTLLGLGGGIGGGGNYWWKY